MKQRTVLLIAAGVTAFTLVGVGMLVRISGPQTTVDAMPTTAAVGQSTVPSPTVEIVLPITPANQPATPSVAVPTPEQEAAYRQLIQEANRRLEQANQRIAQLEQQLSQADQQAASPSQTAAYAQARAAAAAPAPSTSAPVVALTPQQALALGLQQVPDSSALKMPELVDFQGKVAYEVVLNLGVLYLDANTGAVLYNGVSAPAVAQPAATYPRNEEHDDDHEDDDAHEEDEDDDAHEEDEDDD